MGWQDAPVIGPAPGNTAAQAASGWKSAPVVSGDAVDDQLRQVGKAVASVTPAQGADDRGWLQRQIDAAGVPFLSSTAAQESYAQRQFQNAPGRAGNYLQGLTLGFGDELGGAIAGAGAFALSGGDPAAADAAYGKTRDDMRRTAGEYAERNPGSAFGLNLLGGLGAAEVAVAPALAAGAGNFGARLGQAAGTGAAFGGLAGFGSGEGGVENRVASAGTGAVAGAAFGSAAEGAATAFGRLWRAVSNRQGAPVPVLDDNGAPTPEARQMAQEANLDIDADPTLLQRIDAVARRGGRPGDAESAARLQAESLRVPVNLTAGQASGDLAQLNSEEALRRSALGDRGAQVMRNADDDAQRALAANLPAIQASMGPAIVPRGAGGEMAQGRLVSMEATERARANDLYRQARDLESESEASGVPFGPVDESGAGGYNPAIEGEFPRAQQEVNFVRGADQKTRSAGAVRTIQAMGGIRTVDNAGRLTPEGQAIRDLFDGKYPPGLVNNGPGGRPLDNVREALDEQGWFPGKAVADQTTDDVLDLISTKARPPLEARNADWRAAQARDNITGELNDLGVGGKRVPVDAAAMRLAESRVRENPLERVPDARRPGAGGEPGSLGDVQSRADALADPIAVAQMARENPQGFADQMDRLRVDTRRHERELAQKYGVKRVDDLDNDPRLTREERNFLFYSEGPTDGFRQNALTEMVAPVEDAADAASETARALRNLPDTTDLETMSATGREALGRLVYLEGEYQRLGLDPVDVVKQAVRNSGLRQFDGNDAEFVAKDLLQRVSQFVDLSARRGASGSDVPRLGGPGGVPEPSVGGGGRGAGNNDSIEASVPDGGPVSATGFPAERAGELLGGLYQDLKSNGHYLRDLKPIQSEMQDLTRTLNEKGALPVGRMFQALKNFSKIQSDGGESAVAAGRAKAYIERELDRGLEEGLLEGDQGVIDAYRAARSNYADYASKFKSADLVGMLVERDRKVRDANGFRLKVEPSRAASTILGNSALNMISKANLNRDLLKVRDLLGPESEEWNAIRQEAFLRIATESLGGSLPGEAARLYSGAKFDKAVTKFRDENPRLWETLFTATERRDIGNLAQVMRRVTTKDPATYGPSTTPYIQRILNNQVLRKIPVIREFADVLMGTVQNAIGTGKAARATSGAVTPPVRPVAARGVAPAVPLAITAGSTVNQQARLRGRQN